LSEVRQFHACYVNGLNTVSKATMNASITDIARGHLAGDTNSYKVNEQRKYLMQVLQIFLTIKTPLHYITLQIFNVA